MSLEFLQRVVDHLTDDAGLAASLEHPGFIAIPHADGSGTQWAFGNVNDTWQGELRSADGGEVLEVLDTYVRRDCDRPDVVAVEIARRLLGER